MNWNKKSVIKLTPASVLLSEKYYRRLWLAVRNMDISRRDWLDIIADMFRDFDGEIVQEDGALYDIPLVDDVFGSDNHMRWLGYFLEADNDDAIPRFQSRKIERLQLLDLYFRIKHPRIAKHFSR